jgi:putative ABC transport system ATP-binding protein
LLCDEPTGSLDLVTGRQVLAVLSDLARNSQQTVVVVTHNSEISRMADRVLWLHSGAISKTEMIENPVNASELDW